jgi:hypothetical protein
MVLGQVPFGQHVAEGMHIVFAPVGEHGVQLGRAPFHNSVNVVHFPFLCSSSLQAGWEGHVG